MKIRLKFSKDGVMKYIGHLDVMRYFQMLIRRADIPISYSTGMSPHQIMSFAMPLGIGLESDAEYVDIEITEPISSKEAINRLNDEGVEGIRVKSFKLLPDNARNAMASIFAAEYEVGFLEGYEPDFS
ncbi:MAG: TIGR03936 family radical SAM-associated protein, partial [Lachnospiraceae bacterium]|nr:TIGR03936 family radical SAM-associated protein [Lachnospiraceae bacterium]